MLFPLAYAVNASHVGYVPDCSIYTPSNRMSATYELLCVPPVEPSILIAHPAPELHPLPIAVFPNPTSWNVILIPFPLPVEGLPRMFKPTHPGRLLQTPITSSKSKLLLSPE